MLDAFRFLRDIAKERGGGLQYAIEKRGGLSKIRCLSARKDPEIIIGIELVEPGNGATPKWRYEIGLKQEQGGRHQPFVSSEKVWDSSGVKLLDRPDAGDKRDKARLQQTYLEQVNNNQGFREIAEYLNGITYMHLVPQLLRHSDDIQGKVLEDDPFGQGFLQKMARTPKRYRESRLNMINKIIQIAVPQLKNISIERDETSGRPHITSLYSHWRAKGARQREDQFSDGTLRLMALIWSLLEGDSLLLLEEPELSLHAGIVEKLAALLYRAQQRKKRQILISTHSAELLSDKGIGGEEVLLLTPADEGTKVEVSSELADVKSLLSADVSVGEVVISRTRPKNAAQLGIPFD